MTTWRIHAAAASCVLTLTTMPALANDVQFFCDGGTRLTATFSGGGAAPGNVVLVFAGAGGKLTLPQVKSADGGRYANADVELWIRGSDATLTRGGRSEKCVAK